MRISYIKICKRGKYLDVVFPEFLEKKIMPQTFSPEEKTHFILSCLAMFNMGNMVPRIAFRKGTMP